ncbi:MAG: carbohydrate kinase [Spirochaetales bacterium]|nr:carbohydrate kinase [Spirochaetales bacterium]
MNYAIAVLDIGKTNKKIALYDDSMRPLTVRKRKIGTLLHNDLEIENVAEVESWFLTQLKELATEYPIRTISITTHGATVVCVGEDGKPVLPPVAYTNDVPEDVHQRFWEAMGPCDDLQKQTATAEIKPLINIAKLLWFQKERWPEEFQRISHVLFYPQYFGFRLTGIPSADITYAGCHSYLWDYEKWDWSSLVDLLGIRGKLPSKPSSPQSLLGKISPEVVMKTGLSPDVMVTQGIHDSNSSLVPYILSQKEDFVLNSTGTWCVAMHPVETVEFAPDELGKMVYFNLSFQEKPVKTSILMGGLEYETYSQLLMEHHQRQDWPLGLPSTYARIIEQQKSFILPTVVPGTGQFPDSMPRVVDSEKEYSLESLQTHRQWPQCFDDYEEGFALANLSLAIQTSIALQRVGLQPGTEVFIEGGFRQNPHYGALLGALLPENPLYLTALEEATSFGAALCGKSLVENVPVESLGEWVSLDKQPVQPASYDALQAYVDQFLIHLGQYSVLK